VVVLDLLMPHVSGQELLARITVDFPGVPVIVMSAADDVETAIACMKAGAIDYLVKPVEADRLVSTIRKTFEFHNLRGELTSLKEYLLTDVLKHEDVFSNIITRSKKMRSIFQYLEAVAPTPHTVMITGETGVGKELVAQAVHRLSGRKGDFVVVNAAGLDDTMFSDTLFGHTKGAFTGAEQSRRGLIARAENGTLFLDEIGDLSPYSQVKLLRLLQEGAYYSLGSDSPLKSSARIVAATNKDQEALVNGEKLRKDLYYRLCSHRVHIPALRERPEDIPALLDHFVEVAARSTNKAKPVLHPGLANFLSKYDFPGNVRELEAMVYDAVARHKSGMLSMGGFNEVTTQKGPAVDESVTLRNIFGHFPTFDEAEDYLINEAMRLTGGNQSAAASFLGITRQALNRRLKKKP
jgi:DNA-binding NtrC family response regulator